MRKAIISCLGVRCPYCGVTNYRDLDNLEVIKITAACPICGERYKLRYRKFKK